MNDETLIAQLRATVGARHVITDQRKTEPFRKGFRSGEGEALCVIRPGSLVEMWRALKLIVAADKIVIMQAANTGLTEGSTPNGNYDRDVVLINTKRIDQIHLIEDGRQVVSLAGATLFQLEKLLAPIGRQPHSVIGSSCIGASIIGGVCNNSGGSLVERGPSYTELALFAQIDADGRLRLVNHLDVELGDEPEEMLSRLDKGLLPDVAVRKTNRLASDTEYAERVRDVNASSPARYNADKRRLYEAAGCAGKLAVFAVRQDTYPKAGAEKVFYIGSNDAADLTEIRRKILNDFETLPVSAEYLHREIFDISEAYGKDTVLAIKQLGTDRLPHVFALKGFFDSWFNKISLTRHLTDRVMYGLGKVLPRLLPKRMMGFRDKYEHHLILKMRDGGIDEARTLLKQLFEGRDADFFECTEAEGKTAELHRFAAAGAAVRYQAVHASRVADILALDIALPRNCVDWVEELPPHINEKIEHKLYYGHFMCHVFHQDYIVKKGVDVKALKAEMLELLNARGAEYPAEHNVGHMYEAKPDLAAFYKEQDPTNSMNPGIGKMSKKRNYA
ncbi:D-lactate dehydrogenase [Maritalea porphyrae]|uniref:Quinone-dependent D-lactate dehydrogenase n=1 Tax=Maritalea porphyrae TaxID=880732 RepID=A0ABQ5ULL1_9HYPH|nr:D-lactate dehydrogenase [Maritalea porphyrae]GLQ16153.1 D-lactate dehydrogenase [Maritalea porphyrae]